MKQGAGGIVKDINGDVIHILETNLSANSLRSLPRLANIDRDTGLQISRFLWSPTRDEEQEQ